MPNWIGNCVVLVGPSHVIDEAVVALNKRPGELFVVDLPDPLGLAVREFRREQNHAIYRGESRNAPVRDEAIEISRRWPLLTVAISCDSYYDEEEERELTETFVYRGGEPEMTIYRGDRDDVDFVAVGLTFRRRAEIERIDEEERDRIHASMVDEVIRRRDDATPDLPLARQVGREEEIKNS